MTQNAIAWVQAHLNLWFLVGIFGQCMFMTRFTYQWLASEKARKSVMPDIFWYFSLSGGVILLVYAIHQQDPVFILGQGLGVFIYLRNIYFVRTHKRNNAATAADTGANA